MTQEYVLPLIACEDYEKFRRGMGQSLPKSYAEWSNIFVAQVDNARLGGKTIVLAPIKFDEFTQSCSAQGIKPDHKNLIAFAVTKRLVANA